MLNLLIEGLELAAFGMTAVFILLGGLVFAISGMSRLARQLEPAAARPAAAPSAASAEPDLDELTVAVAAAIHAYRRRSGG